MSVPRILFQFYLVDTPSYGCYYVENNIVKIASVGSGRVLWLPQHPDGWKDVTMTFARNSRYFGLNRSFTIPLRFVEDGAQIIRELYYNGKGIETPLSLIILKWNETTTIYELYYEGKLDLSNIIDDVEVGVSVNLMEGGVNRMLSAYEKIVFEIECDGSIPENIKANVDGPIQDDTFFYNIVPFTNSGANLFSPLPITFQSNNGDNVGIIHGNQNYDPQNTDTHWNQKSGNYFLSSVDAFSPTITGFITVEAEDASHFANFQLKFLTNEMTTLADDSMQLLTFSTTQGYLKRVSAQRTYHFSLKVDLRANERLFFAFLNNIGTATTDQNLRILGGSFTVQLATRFNATAVWGMTLRDLFKLLIKRINELSTQGTEVFNYPEVSELLDNHLNYFVTSGDAIRASGDSSYSKYYNLKNVDLSTGNVISTADTFGPVIKTSLSDLFDACNAEFLAALGTDGTSIFIEERLDVMNPTEVNMNLGEVSNLKITTPKDYFFNDLEIGYPEQQYDQKGGKYEFNTTAKYAGVIKTVSQKLSIICPYRADTYGIEKLRSDVSNVSSTQNNSDASVFLLNVDFSTFVYDRFHAFFLSILNDPTQALNDNLVLTPELNGQNLPMFQSTGDYFQKRNDSTIFVFVEPTLVADYAVTLDVAGTLNGPPGETLTIELVVNGVVEYSQVFTSTGVNTPISVTGTIATPHFEQNTVLYLRVATSDFAEVEINSIHLTVGGSQLVANSSGLLTIPPAVPVYFIPLPDVTLIAQVGGKDIAVTGFDYYVFDSILINNFFDYQFNISAYMNGPIAEAIHVKGFLNGVFASVFTMNGDSVGWVFRQNFVNASRNWDLNDFIFFLADVDNTQVQVSEMNFVATSQIKAYGLKRVTYDSITGIPHPETAYNIEEFTPKRLFNKWRAWFGSVMGNLVPSKLMFKTLSKNRFLRTALGTEIFDEDSDEVVPPFSEALFLPYIFEFDTEVPDTFASIMTNARNAHIKFTYRNVDLYGFPVQMMQKPSLNESQKWKLLCSPLVNRADLVDLQFTGINFLDMYQMFIPNIVGAKFVPFIINRDPHYNFIDMDSDWFINQFSGWIARKTNYYQKIQKDTDSVPLQVRTNGLAPVKFITKNCHGETIVENTFDQVPLGGVLNGSMMVFQKIAYFTDVPDGIYYIIIQAGIGDTVATAISEGFHVRSNWANTLLLTYFHRRNILAAIFDEGWSGVFRVEGTLIDFMPESEFVTYVDEPEDISLLNGRPFRTFVLMLGYSDGLPDWMIDKVNSILLLSNVTIDGIQYTRDTGAKFEVTKFPGQPKKYWTIKIRPAINRQGTTFNLDDGDDAGNINKDISIVYNIDANAFGTNSGVSNVVEVEFQNP